ncbi:MAG: NUDIX hydrolase, partial [Chloroflexi bacterium]|nr:NUDIX hydrolase [Chloroflexota bacterium]
EEPDVTAHRELREETGYDADSLVRIGGAWMAPGFTSEYIHFYLATGLRESPLDTGDEEDLGAPIPCAREAIEAAVAAGEIEDAKTLVALQLYELHTRRGAATAG